MKKIVAAILFVVCGPFFSAWASADAGVTLKLDRGEATLSDSVRLEVSVSGSRSNDQAPVLHGLEEFLVSKGGTSSRLEIINGKVNAGLTFTYFIQPKKTGTFTVGPAEIKVDGRLLASNRATLVVQSTSHASGIERGPVFIEAAVSSPDVFVEEQAVYTLKLYHRVDVDDLSLSLPEMDQLVFRQLGRPREYEAIVAGTRYGVMEIRYALTASKEGAYVIEPSRMHMTVKQPGAHSPFDDFFNDPFFRTPFSGFTSGRPLTVATRPLELKVLALPDEGKPADFSGLVGNFRLESRLEPDRLKAGESATLTVQVSGRGNVSRIPDINLPEIAQVRTYNDQSVLKTEQDANGIGGTKTMKWALVPEKAGRVEVPRQTLSFFNPETKKYAVLETPAHTLSVLPGETGQTAALHASPGLGATARGPVQNAIQQIGKDILPIHTNAGEFSVPLRALSTGWGLGLAFIGPLSIYLLLLGGLKVRNRSAEHLTQQRSRQAFKLLARRCRKEQAGCAGLIEVFKEYLNDRFALSIGTLTAAEVEKLLQAKGVDSHVAERMRYLVRRLEDAVYAGEDYPAADAAGELAALVKELEKKIR